MKILLNCLLVDLKSELDYLSHIIPPMLEYLEKINEINQKFDKPYLRINIEPNSEEFQNLLVNVLDSNEMSLFVGNGNLIKYPQNQLSTGYYVNRTKEVTRNLENIHRLIVKLSKS